MAIETIKIKPGQIFECEGKMYIISIPKTASEDTNEHGQVIFPLVELEA